MNNLGSFGIPGVDNVGAVSGCLLGAHVLGSMTLVRLRRELDSTELAEVSRTVWKPHLPVRQPLGFRLNHNLLFGLYRTMVLIFQLKKCSIVARGYFNTVYGKKIRVGLWKKDKGRERLGA